MARYSASVFQCANDRFLLPFVARPWRTSPGRKCEYRLLGVNDRLCGKHDIQKMDVERQVFPNPDIPGEIPE
jgi:hypothetical protein